MSEKEQALEGQNETAGEDAAKAELPVGDLSAPPNPPDQTAEQIANEEAEKDAQDAAKPGGIPSGEDDGSKKDPAAPPVIAEEEAEKVEQAAAEDAEVIDEDDFAVDYDYSADGLQLWKCHKTVAAFKITETESLSNGQVRLIGRDDQVVVCDSAYVDKHRPQIGGYFVRYHDGYRSWSPAEAFEDGYTPAYLEDQTDKL